MEALLDNFPNYINSKQKKKPPSIYAPCAPAPPKRRAKFIETDISLPQGKAAGYANEPFLHPSHHQPITATYLYSLRQSLDEIHACIAAALVAPRRPPCPGTETYMSTTHMHNAVRHAGQLVPALARLSSHPHLFPDPVTARAFWNITRLHLYSLRRLLSAYTRITRAWRAFSEGDEALIAVAKAVMTPLQRTPQGEIVPPWRTYLGMRPASFVLPPGQAQVQSHDAVAISREWEGCCPTVADMRNVGWVPVLVQMAPPQGALIADAWRDATANCVNAVSWSSANPEHTLEMAPSEPEDFFTAFEPTDPSGALDDQRYCWMTAPGNLPAYIAANLTLGNHEKPAECARMFCKLGRMNAITRGESFFLFRMLMRKMTPEEVKREEALVQEEKRQEFLKWKEGMNEQMGRWERGEMSPKRDGEGEAEGGDAGTGAGADEGMEEMEEDLEGGDADDEVVAAVQ